MNNFTSNKSSVDLTTNPVVSVVIPAFNAEKWIEKTIQSVLAQSFVNFELILVDDGSTDTTRNIVHTFADPRIQYIYQENRGLSGARNSGIKASRGKYIALLDADDISRPERLEEQVTELENRPDLGVVTCGFELIDDQGSHISDELHWILNPEINLATLLFFNPLLPSTLMIRRDLFDKFGYFDETLTRYEDWELPLRFARAGCRMDYVKKILVGYRRHDSNMSVDPGLVTAATESALRFMNDFFSNQDLSSSVKDLRPKAIASIYLDATARAFGVGLGDLAIKYLRMALENDPALRIGNPPGWVVALTGFAQDSLVHDWRKYLEFIGKFFATRPEFRNWSAKKLVAYGFAAQAFKSRSRGNKKLARKCSMIAILNDFSLFRNRGLVKLLLL